jgi:hypothetical protein
VGDELPFGCLSQPPWLTASAVCDRERRSRIFWGDTMDDREVLSARRRLNEAGSIFEHITHRADDQ